MYLKNNKIIYLNILIYLFMPLLYFKKKKKKKKSNVLRLLHMINICDHVLYKLFNNNNKLLLVVVKIFV